MKELISSFLSSDLSILHTSGGGIMLAFAGTVLVAMVSYCIYRAAIIGLKLASICTVVYLLASIVQLPAQDAKTGNSLTQKNTTVNSLSDVREEIRGLLDSTKDNILPIISSLLQKA